MCRVLSSVRAFCVFLVFAGVSPSLEAGLLYAANFDEVPSGNPPLTNTSGASESFTVASDSGTGGTCAIRAASAPFGSPHLQLTRPKGGEPGFFKIAQTKIADADPGAGTFVLSFDFHSADGGKVTPQIQLASSGGNPVHSVALEKPVRSDTLIRTTYVVNGSGSDLMLPGTLGTLPSGSAALYTSDGITFKLSAKEPLTGTDNIRGFAIRANLRGGRACGFDNFGVWDSASDAVDGVNVLELAPGTLISGSPAGR